MSPVTVNVQLPLHPAKLASGTMTALGIGGVEICRVVGTQADEISESLYVGTILDARYILNRITDAHRSIEAIGDALPQVAAAIARAAQSNESPIPGGIDPRALAVVGSPGLIEAVRLTRHPSRRGLI